MKYLKALVLIIIISIILVLSLNYYIIFTTKDSINTLGNESYEIGLVLGCSARKDGSPSKMLKDRLDRAISLYENKKIKKILVTGDHQRDYSEVDAMYNYLINNNIKEEDIYRDNVGFSTSISLKNYFEKYSNTSVIIISQKYHLYRALYIAKRLNLNAVGSSAKEVRYFNQTYRDIREVLARNKDFWLFLFN